MVKMVLQSALTRIFPNMLQIKEIPPDFSALSGETVSFQMALFLENKAKSILVCLKTRGAAARWSQIRWVSLVPSEYPCHPNPDERHEHTQPGLFPDPLQESVNGTGRCVAGQWRAAWIDVEVPKDASPGSYPLFVSLYNHDKKLLCEKMVHINVLKGVLPAQRLIHTEWFHTDCLADFYKAVPRSAQWWGIVERFVECAARRGINMILTPIFTPPLDTEIGTERTTVQLVDIFEEDGIYRFDFKDLIHWVRMCHSLGIEYFEMPHLFTQWGAKFAPKIIVWKNGEKEKRFGWHTLASSEEYHIFLIQFIPALTTELSRLGIAKNTVFHISDEPDIGHLEDYQKAYKTVQPLLKDFQIIDSISDYELYERGIVQTPIVATDHIAPFLEHHIPNLWVYYCTGQDRKVSNRFFGMPLDRCRVLGVQLYRYNIHGFLHWGFNFYNSSRSRRKIDPFRVTDADCTLPSGDSFIVYPGANGKPMESIRLMIMHRAMQDLCLLQLLESLESREYVLSLLDEEFAQQIAFEEYPSSVEQLPAFFEFVRRKVSERLENAN